MKNIYFLLIFFTSLIHAQTFTCGTVYEPEEEFTTFNNDIIPDDNEIFVINIFFHVVTDNNGNIDLTGGTTGTTPNTYGEEEMMEVIWALNRVYGQYNIFFKYRGFDVIANSNLTNYITTDTSPYMISGNFNVFIMNNLGGNQGFGNSIRARVIFAAMENHMERSLVHEIGHCMDLLHTFNPGPFSIPGSPGQTVGCEHVTRDPNDPDYNAHYTGDMVEDTAAEGTNFNWSNWNSNCEFVNPTNLMDCDGTGVFADIELNYLSSSLPPGCNDAYVLTPGQALRARTFLKNAPSWYQDCLTTVEELYKPYFSGAVPYDIRTVSDNGDGTLTVCWRKKWECRFQKGFYYDFKGIVTGSSYIVEEDEWPVLNPVRDIYVQVYRSNVIANSNKLMPNDYRVRMPSMNGDICLSETVISGSMVSTLMIGSNVYTQTTLTPAQLTDPNFYTTLTPGYYHIITKQTAQGLTFTKTVYIP